MQFEFSNISTQCNQSDVIASITRENMNASKSNLDSVYESSDLNLDAAVLSISTKGSAKINAMLSKSIQLRANTANPNLTTQERKDVSQELRELRHEMEVLRRKEHTSAERKVMQNEENDDVSMMVMSASDAEQMVEESKESILKYADESLKSQILDRECVLQLLVK